MRSSGSAPPSLASAPTPAGHGTAAVGSTCPTCTSGPSPTGASPNSASTPTPPPTARSSAEPSQARSELMANVTAQSPATQSGRPPWLPWSAFPFKSRFAVIDSKRIHYIDEGSGPALLFVSAGQWAFMFRDVVVRLRGQFRCLALDFPGCGLSPDAPGHDHSVPANARILAGFIDAL